MSKKIITFVIQKKKELVINPLKLTIMTYENFIKAMQGNKTIYGSTEGIQFDIRNLDSHSCFIRTIIKAFNNGEPHFIYNTTEEDKMKTYWMIESNDFNWWVDD